MPDWQLLGAGIWLIIGAAIPTPPGTCFLGIRWLPYKVVDVVVYAWGALFVIWAFTLKD